MMFDACIIGGGINGTGIARDLSGRGLKVLLLEKDDLAQGTSSRSTKLIHGGLRYLETYNFKLVRESLQERARLLKLAPHVIWPLRFVLPHVPSLRPRWMIRCGLFMYDYLAPRAGMSASRGLSLLNSPLKENYSYGFDYSDCWVDDARLVVLNAIDAKQKGAVIHTHTACTALQPHLQGWKIKTSAKEFEAKVVINAAGPWVAEVLQNGVPQNTALKIKLSKGSHIVVPKMHAGDEAYILQQPDGRIVFAIPYEHHFTLIGTTDEIITGHIDDVSCSQSERDYLINAVNSYFQTQISAADIVWCYSGVRPLIDDGQNNISKVTRDYKIQTQKFGSSQLITLIGGKLTTYRIVSEHISNMVVQALGTKAPPWTDRAVLPGGDMDHFDEFLCTLVKTYKSFPSGLLARYARAYGTRALMILNQNQGTHFGDHIYQAELDYLREHEWMRSVDDFLWRRSKLGLHISQETRKSLESYFQ